MSGRYSVKAKLKSRNLRGSIWGAVLYLSFLVFLLLPSPAHAQAKPQILDSSNPKRILVLYSYGYSLPSYQKFTPAFLSVMADAGVKYSDLFFEYLDLLHIRDREHRQALKDMLRHKYAETNIDLIITVHAPATLFLLDEARDILPGVPTIFMIMQQGFKREPSENRDLQLFAGIDVRGTLEAALKLFPKTKHVVLISGTALVDTETEREAKAIFSQWESKLQFEYTSYLSVEEMLERVANLPPQSIVIYWNVLRDKTGRVFIPTDVGKMVAMRANAPVFCLYDTLIGLGVVGGSLQSYEAAGARAGNLALDILSGRISVPEETEQFSVSPVPMFDWKQLERWGADKSKLPKGSILVNRPLSPLHQYKWHITGFLIFSLAQTFLLVGLLINMRRRKSAEDSLTKTEEKYRNIFEGALEGIYEHSPEGKNLTANPALAQMLGYDSPEKLMSSVIDSAQQLWVDPNQRLEYILILDQQNIIRDYECEFYRKDGSKIWVSLNSRRVIGRDGNTLHYSGFIENITERKRTRERIEKSEAKYRRLHQSMMDGFVLVDLDGIIREFNATYQKMTGYLPEELLRLSHRDLTPEKWHDIEQRIIQEQVLTRGYSEVYEKEFRKKDGTIFPVELRTFLLRDELGSNIGLWAIVRDITSRKQSELETRKLREELAHLTRVSTVGEFTSALAHEISQPLTAILSNAQAALRFLSQTPLDIGEVRQILDDIIRDDGRASEVIRTVRALVRKDQPRKEPLDLNEMIRQVVGLFRGDFLLQGLSIGTDLNPGLATVHGDGTQLQQVILNLILNAAAAMRNAPLGQRKIIVRTTMADNRTVKASVTDFGVGIDENNIERLFEPFYTTKPEGLGMGLSISRTIIKTHGGTMEASNNREGGATFAFTLPALQGDRS